MAAPSRCQAIRASKDSNTACSSTQTPAPRSLAPISPAATAEWRRRATTRAATLHDCVMSDVRRGTRGYAGSRIEVRDCDISFAEAGIQTSGGVTTVERCRRITVPGRPAPVRRPPTAVRSRSTTAGCSAASSGSSPTTPGRFARMPARSSTSPAAASTSVLVALLIWTRDVDHAGLGVWCEGEATIDACRIHDDSDFGVRGDAGTLTLSGTVVYRNSRAGVVLYETSTATLQNSIVILHPNVGVAVLQHHAADAAVHRPAERERRRDSGRQCQGHDHLVRPRAEHGFSVYSRRLDSATVTEHLNRLTEPPPQRARGWLGAAVQRAQGRRVRLRRTESCD